MAKYEYDALTGDVHDDGLLVLTMRRPKQYNAWRPSEFVDVADALTKAAADERVIVVVLTGEGKFFSSGADLKASAGLKMDSADALRAHFNRSTKLVTDTLIDFPKVAIAALNGPVVGLPAAILPLFDVVYAAEGASLSLPFTTLAINSEGAASFSLPLAVGLSNAGEMLILAKPQTSKDLLQKGLVSRVFPNETFEKEVLAIAHDAAKLPRNSLLANKRLLRAPIKKQLHDAINNEVEGLIERFLAGEPQQVFAAFAAGSKAFSKPKL